MISPRIQPTHLHYQDVHTPFHPDFGDVYFSAESGIEESTYVYLEGSGFIQAVQDRKKRIVVGEIGFGVGLNFILTAQHFFEKSDPKQELFYISVEKHPIFLEDLKELYSRFPEIAAGSQLLLKNYPTLTPGFHRISLAGGRITLLLLLGDALELLPRLDAQVNIWYWDGFSPQKNPDAFSESLFQQVVRLSAPNVQGASFTAAGWVRRSMEAAGFKITKRPGFGAKRECIHASRDAGSSDGDQGPHQPWFSSQNLKRATPGKDRIAVIGAGLAGTAVASALARRGFEVSLLDSKGIAMRTSGNPAGLFNVQLSKIPNPMSRFSQLSLVHFLRELDQSSIPRLFGILREDEKNTESFENSEYPPSFYHLSDDGIFLPHCGMLKPQRLCEERINHSRIQFIQAHVARVRKTESTVALLNEDGTLILEAEHVIYTLGSDLLQFEHPFQHSLLQSLPFRPIRGQLLRIKPTDSSQTLKHVLVNEGYVTPIAPEITGNQEHILGATYQGKTVLPEQEALDTEKLITEAKEKWPIFASLTSEHVVSTQVGYRLSTPDKLPMIGPICDDEWLKLHYERALRGTKIENLPPLQGSDREWMMMGLGSRGITFSSLGAEILAAVMCGEPLPIESDLWEHLHSARFFVRALRKST